LSSIKGAAYNEATLLLRAFGHGVAAWTWLDLALNAERTKPPEHLAGATYVLRYFTEIEFPLARSWFSIVDQHFDTVVQALDDIFN
jgi:hypothetical protein